MRWGTAEEGAFRRLTANLYKVVLGTILTNPLASQLAEEDWQIETRKSQGSLDDCLSAASRPPPSEPPLPSMLPA